MKGFSHTLVSLRCGNLKASGSQKRQERSTLLAFFIKGTALFLSVLIDYFLFYFSVFSKNPFTLPGFALLIIFDYFFLEYAVYIFLLSLPLTSQVSRFLNLPFFSPPDLLFLCLLTAYLLKVIFGGEEIVRLRSSIDAPIVIFTLVVISSFSSTFINHYPSDFLYKEKVIEMLKRMLFIHNPYDYSYIFTSTFKILEGILLFFLVTNVAKNDRIIRRIYFLLILGWGIAVSLGFIQYFGGVLGNERWPTRMFSMFDNPNLFGGYLILVFPFSILYARSKPSVERIILFMVSTLSVVGLILSRSKNSWVAFAMLLFIMGIYLVTVYTEKGRHISSITKINRKWVCIFVVVLVIVFGGLYIYLSKGSISGLLSEDLNWRVPVEKKLDIRLPLWKYSFEIIEDFPLWGVGIGEFGFVLQKYSSMFVSSKESTFQTHNYFLQIAVELGMVGLYSFLWVLGTISIKGYQTASEEQGFIKLGLWFGIMGFVLTFFGDGYLWNIEMQFLFWLFVALLFANGKGDINAWPVMDLREKRRMILFSAIVVLTIPFQVYERSQIFYPVERTLGLYPEELKDEERGYRWGEKVVMIPIEVKGNWINIPIKFGNPDIKGRAVEAKIVVDRKLIDRLEFKDNDWHLLRYRIPNAEGHEIILKIEVSRTWNPYLMGVGYDPKEGPKPIHIQELGPALGQIYWSS